MAPVLIPPVTALGIPRICHDRKVYEFKLVLSPEHFRDTRGLSLRFCDSSGNPVRHESNVWGRKVRLKFLLDDAVSDGVATISVQVSGSAAHSVQFWVIK